jgi:hypothetical protein
MRTLSNTARSDSSSETPGDSGDIAEAFTGKDYYQDLINRANTIPLVRIFKLHHIRLDEYNKKTTCPFKSHKGGRESTPSFYFYPETNTYYCFGCKAGVRPCDFIAEIDRCTKVQAAHKLLELFGEEVDEDNVYDPQSFKDRLTIMMDFSNTVREFYQTYSTDDARVYIEGACKKYDALNLKHQKLDNDALRSIVKQLKDYINLYKP